MKNFIVKTFDTLKRKNGSGNGSGIEAKRPKRQESLLKSHPKIEKERKKLPIFSAKQNFLKHVSGSGNAFILVGETGSGKTTQIPQYLLEAGLLRSKSVLITQPRRVAAVSVAQRVAQELNDTQGEVVGYKIRFEDATTPRTKIVFATDGLAVREVMEDADLDKYSWLILDEAHERTLNTDILFGVVKNALKKRSDLKIIVMSATLEAEKFSKFFDKAPILYVCGRQHPVNIRHTSESIFDYQTAAFKVVLQIHREAERGHDILVFLTGQDEIESMCLQLKKLSEELQIQPIGLFAAQSSLAQQKAFEAPRNGFRKVVVSTNIAETSLTIPGVKYVIDSCRVKAKLHLSSTGMDVLKVVKVSKAQAVQRAGRAGRESEGHCYRLITQGDFDKLEEATMPEILRCNLSNALLHLLKMGVENINDFPLLDRPRKEAVQGALRQLQLLGAVQGDRLTTLGSEMAAFPLEPRFTKAIMAAKDLGCTEEVITIVAVLSTEAIFMTSNLKRDEAQSARKRFETSEGDHIGYLNIFRAFNGSKDKKAFCKDNFLHFRHLAFASEIRRQLMEICRRENVPVQSSGRLEDKENGGEIIRKALALGLFTNVAKLTRDNDYVTLDSKQSVKVHPSSSLFRAGSRPEVVIFTEYITTSRSFIRDLSPVDSKWLVEAQPDYFRQHRI